MALIAAGAPASAAPDPSFVSALADVRAMLAASPDATGLAVAVTDRDQTLMVAMHGDADIERHLPVTAETHFAIGSISKSFAALALLEMADEGRFDPAAPVARYLPEFHPRSTYAAITGHSLLTHTSGLPNYLHNVASMRAEIAALNELELTYEPGAHYWYSNSGYQLLGYVAERIDGIPYPLVLQRRVLDRLGMIATAPQIDDRLRETIAKSYVRAPDGRMYEAPWFSYLAADGGIVSTAPDMARYARMLLARGATSSGRLVSTQAFERLATPVLDDYGYGFDIHDGGKVLAHSGAIAGFRAYLHADLGHGWGAVFLANGPLDRQLRDRIITRLTVATGGIAPAAAAAATPFPPPAAFAGRFNGIDGKALTFEVGANDDLILRDETAALPLTRLGRDTWGAYLTSQGPRSFVFFRDAAGKTTDVSEGTASYVRVGKPSGAPERYKALAGRYMAHGGGRPGIADLRQIRTSHDELCRCRRTADAVDRNRGAAFSFRRPAMGSRADCIRHRRSGQGSAANS